MSNKTLILITLNCQAWFTRGYLFILWLILLISQGFIHCFLCSRLYAKWCRYRKVKANTPLLKVRAQSRPTLCNPMDCSPPDSPVPGISQARIMDWVAISYSRASSLPWHWTCLLHSCLATDPLPLSHLGSPFPEGVLSLMKKIHQWTSSSVCDAISIMTQTGLWFSIFFNLKEKQRHWPTVGTQ